MKKPLSLFLAIYMSVMCCGMFVACGNVDVPTGEEKPDGQTAAVYYAYDAEMDEYDDENYITLKGSDAAWHGIDVSLGEVDFTGSVHYAGNEFTITVNGEFSSMDKCLMTYRGKKEDGGVLKVNSTVITKYSELVDPSVTTDTTVRYFCKKGSKPKNPVLPPEVETDGTYYEYDPQTGEYDNTGYYVIDGSNCSIVMDYGGVAITLTGTFSVAKKSFEMDCKVNIAGVFEMRVVNKGEVEKRGVLHVTHTEMYSAVTGDITENMSSYFCIKGITPNGYVAPEPVVVTFDGNSGTFDGKASVEVKAGGNGCVTLPEQPQKTGFVFNGYNTKKDGSGETADKNTPFTENTTVFAIWAKEVTVTFVSDGHTMETKKVGQGMELGKTPYLSDTDSAMFIGWFDREKQYNSYSKVDGDLTLYAEWRTQADIDEYNVSMWAWTKPNHLYIHYLRRDHNVSEEGTSQPNNAAPNYSTPIDSKTYGDWALWAWPRTGNNYGRAFFPMKIDMSGAVYDIDLTYTFTDLGWDPVNKVPLDYNGKFDTQQIGMQLFKDSTRYDSGFWANDGGDNYLTQTFIQGQHVFVVEGSVSSRHMSSRMVLNVAHNPYA